MKTLLSILAILAAMTVGCRNPKPENPGAAAPAQTATPVPAACERLLITGAGIHTTPGGHWRVEVRVDDGSLHVSRLRSGVSSTIGVGGWTAQPGWFAFVENESRVWAFDGARHLSLTTCSAAGAGSAALISYGPDRFPCDLPEEVASRLPQTFRQTIKTNQ